MRKTGVVTGSGGHLTEALSVMEAFKGHDVFLVVHSFPSLREIELEEVTRIYRLRIILGYSSLFAVFITALETYFSSSGFSGKRNPPFFFQLGQGLRFPPSI